MAKGSAMGLWRGKKGSTIFYYNKNSNSAMKQAMRERVYEISNPKTRTQAIQRMKVTPMQRVGTALGEILKRSWQGIEYGGKGLQEFRKLALKMTSGYPYLDKGEQRAVPGEYVISNGTLPTVTSQMNQNKLRIGNLSQNLSAIPTVAQFSQILIDNNSAAEGDQLTIVLCKATGIAQSVFNGFYQWDVKSFICSTADSSLISDVIAPYTATAEIVQGQQKVVAVESTANAPLVAGAIIVSRPSGNTYLRSRQTIKIDSTLDPWFTEERKRTARLTYQADTRATVNSNWEVDPDEATSPGLYTISGSSIASINGQKIWVRFNDETGAVASVYVTTESGGAGGTPPYVLGENGTQVFYTSGSNENAANPTDCGLGDLPTIAWSGIPTD